MGIRFKCTVFHDGKVWRWRAVAEDYLGMAGMAEDEATAEAACKAACDRAVQQRRNQGDTPSHQFEYVVDA